MKFLRILPILLFAVLLGLFGFTLISGQTPSRSPLQGRAAPDFALDNILEPGRQFSLATIRKPALLVFWASWCGICKVDLPVLGRFAAQHDIPLYGIAYHDQLPALQAAVASLSPDVRFTALGLDETGGISTRYGLIGVPTLFVIDAQGAIGFVQPGQVSQQGLENDVLPLLH